MRVNLTMKQAFQLRDAREASGMSQYEVAEKLGWVRSKVKRIEKGETASVEEGDLEGLTKLLSVKDLSAKRVRTEEDNVLHLTDPKGSTKALFKSVSRVERKGNYENQVFFRVTMSKGCQPEALIGRKVELGGVVGTIHGVENSQKQVVLKPNDHLVIMLWGPGIAKQHGRRSSKGA